MIKIYIESFRPIGVFHKIHQAKGVGIEIFPSKLSNEVLWFSNAKVRSRSCKNCSVNSMCAKCKEKFDGGFLLLQNFTSDQVRKEILKMSRVPLNDFNDALFIFNLVKQFEVLTCARIRYLEKKYDSHFYFYMERSIDERDAKSLKNELVPVRKPIGQKYNRKIHFKLYQNFPTTKNGQIGRMELLLSPKLLPRRFTCSKTKNCRYETSSTQRFEKHQKICGIKNIQNITSTQTFYGGDDSVLKQIADAGFIPMEAAEYENYILASFDIETIEEKFEQCLPEKGLTTVARLKLLSLAVGSNLDGYTPKCWVRKNMNEEEELKIIAKFIEELEWIQQQKSLLLPNWIDEGIDAIDEEIQRLKANNFKWFEYSNLIFFKRTLNSLKTLDIFGYNSSKFDIPVIYGPLILELKKKFSKVEVLKKNTSYMSITTSTLSFKDALKYTSPCSYSKYLTVWGVEECKSIWPYTLYGNIQDMKAATKFPPRSQFASELQGDKLPSMEEYIAAKREFARRRLLPKSHPDRIRNMKDWLKLYNITDVMPLAKAIEASFRAYQKYFDVNPMIALSLPALAQKAMFRDVSVDAPLIATFSKDYHFLNLQFRECLYGGLVNVFRINFQIFIS